MEKVQTEAQPARFQPANRQENEAANRSRTTGASRLAAQGRAIEGVGDSPRMVAQRERFAGVATSPRVLKQRKVAAELSASRPTRNGSVVQRVLAAKGSPIDGKAVGDFVKLVNAIFGGHYLLAHEGGNTFSLKAGKSKAPFPVEASVLYSVLSKIINHKKTTSIDFADKDKNVFIGQFDASQIDVSDAKEFGVNAGFEQGPTAASMLVHELEEQFQGQVKNVPMGDDYIGAQGKQDDEAGDAHWDFAIPMEEQAVGGYREGTGPKQYIGESENYTQLIKYSYKSGRVVIVKYTVVGGNVKSVERTIYASEEAWEKSEEWKTFGVQMDDEDVIERKKADIEKEKAALEQDLNNLLARKSRTHVKKKLKALNKHMEEIEFRLSAIKKELIQLNAKLGRMQEDDEGEDVVSD